MKISDLNTKSLPLFDFPIRINPYTPLRKATNIKILITQLKLDRQCKNTIISTQTLIDGGHPISARRITTQKNAAAPLRLKRFLLIRILRLEVVL